MAKRRITIDGVTYPTVAAAARDLGLTYSAAWQRVRKHGTVDVPSRYDSVVVNGVTYASVNDAALKIGVVSAGQAAVRIAAGMTPEEALTLPAYKDREVAAFGVIYPSLQAAADAHGVAVWIVRDRLCKGWSLERALTTPTKRSPAVIIGGKKYKNVAVACRAHEVPYHIYVGRIRCGWIPEQAMGLVPRYDGEKCLGSIYLVTQISTGKHYVGQTIHGDVAVRWEGHLACAAKGAKTPLHRAIRSAGDKDFTLVELSRHNTRDELNAAEVEAIAEHKALVPMGFNKNAGGSGWHKGTPIVWKGKKYRSTPDLARAVGMSKVVLSGRLRAGWSLKRAIETPKITTGSHAQPIVIAGVWYPSRKHACQAYEIDPPTVCRRLKQGWSLERAITEPTGRNAGQVIVVDGVQYKSLLAAAKAYGLSYKTLEHRLNKLNLTPEQAVGIEPWPKGIRKPAPRKAG